MITLTSSCEAMIQVLELISQAYFVQNSLHVVKVQVLHFLVVAHYKYMDVLGKTCQIERAVL